MSSSSAKKLNLRQEYELAIDDIEKLSEFILDKIKADFEFIMDKTVKYIYK